MRESSILWLRLAALLYFVGLVDALLAALRKNHRPLPLALPVFRVGVVLHLVSIVELGLVVGHIPVDNFYESVSMCAFLMALGFLLLDWRYQFSSPRLILFPLVFVGALIGATEIPVASWDNPRLRDVWLLVHVVLILMGYVALVVTAVASFFYLAQERRLKRKGTRSFVDRLPPLGTLDLLITQSMGIGFVLVTLGLVAACTWAFIESGTRWIGEAKIAVAFLTWGVCLVMVFLRTTAGWRGRKAALLAVVALGFLALTWGLHVGLRPLLMQ